MTLKPLIYENVAIGIIAQRIGECRLANRYIVNPQQLITQQIKSLENLYRDSIIAKGDKFIVIEFKAPYLSNKGLRYNNINIRTLTKIAEKFHKRNVFLALIHAYVPIRIVPTRISNGFYLWFAVPGTTAFIPLSSLSQVLKVTGNKVSLNVIRAYPFTNITYISTLTPSCMKQPTPIVKQEPYCASCGGLFSGPSTLKKPRLDIDVNGNTFNIESYTFASLMKSFVNCYLGFEIRNTKEIEELIILLSELCRLISNLALLILGKEGVFFIPVSLSSETLQAEWRHEYY